MVDKRISQMAAKFAWVNRKKVIRFNCLMV